MMMQFDELKKKKWQVQLYIDWKRKNSDFYAKEHESIVVGGMMAYSNWLFSYFFIFIGWFQVLQSFVCSKTINLKNEKLFRPSPPPPPPLLFVLFSISEIEARASTQSSCKTIQN